VISLMADSQVLMTIAWQQYRRSASWLAVGNMVRSTNQKTAPDYNLANSTVAAGRNLVYIEVQHLKTKPSDFSNELNHLIDP